MKRVARPFLLMAVIVLSTCLALGCSNQSNVANLPPDNTVDTPSAEPLALKISYKVYSDIARDDDGTQLIRFRYAYPYIENPNNDEGIAKINNYYQAQLEEFKNTIVPDRKAAALETKKASEEFGFDFYDLYYEQETCVYYNDNQLLSILNICYEYTGGAHPVSYWISETFDVKTGKLLTLSDIFGVSKEEALEKVYETVISQIEATKDEEDKYYFENYEENVKEYYSDGDFVLGHDGIIFYYQLYTIAPYVAGIQTFKLPYDEADMAMEILPTEPNELERDICLNAGRLIEANKDVFYNIFGLAMLPLELPENITGEETLFPVKDNRFRTFTDLDNYIRGIYVKSEADALMGSGVYIDKDGSLYGDMSKAAGMGYYVDWSNYSFYVDEITEKSATINIYVTDDSPAGKEEKTIEVKMLKENDLWLLERMFY